VAQRREELRAADVDRAFVAERLKSALDEGRLSLSEYDERLREAYAARTYGDLDKLLADLPGQARARQMVAAPASPASTAGAYQAVPSAAHRSLPRWLGAVWGAWLTAVLVNIAIWAVISVSTGHAIYFWPIWVAGPWGAVLLAGTVTGLLSGDGPQRHAEQERRRAERRAERRARRSR
jgi:hypothetical protein